MIVERKYYCSRTDCETHVTTLREYPSMGIATCDLGAGVLAWFCSWECVLHASAEYAPLEEIPFGP